MKTNSKTSLLFALAMTGLPACAEQIPMSAEIKVSLPSDAIQNGITDILSVGNPASEAEHGLSADHSEIVAGGLGEPARILLPPEARGWQGGKVTFTMNVDPQKVNYCTVKMWGSDTQHNNLTLFIDGKQVGYRNGGDIAMLNFGDEQPAYNGRFFYVTSPLPLPMTQGKTHVSLGIWGSGTIFPYGNTFENFQMPMTEPTRGIYRVYTHTQGYFAPPSEEKQGDVPARPPLRQEPGPEVIDEIKARCDDQVNKALNSPTPINLMQMQFLARAYHVKWTSAYRNPQAVSKILEAADAVFVQFRKDPRIENVPLPSNPGWSGFGMMGKSLQLLETEVKPLLDLPIADEKGGQISRRTAYTEMLLASVNWLRTHRKLYTNQSMIVDLNLYLSNRGLCIVAPDQALPEARVLDFLYQSIGLKPWLGSDTPNGPEKPVGDNYYELTSKGLTRELGYTGYYGEVLDAVAPIYEATRPTPGAEGDPQIKAQLVKIAQARAPFRYPALDALGNRAMRHEVVVGWRDYNYPGDVTYLQRGPMPLQAAALTHDARLVGIAQQMLADNQFFASFAQWVKSDNFRSTENMLDTPDQYEQVKALPPSPKRLPMSWDQPDFVFTDEEDGVVAVKNGTEIFYASLYWRAEYSVNNLARVHYLTPRFDRVAVVSEETQFEPSGFTFKRPDRVSHIVAPWIPNYPDIHSASVGEELSIAKIPAGVTFQPGDNSPYAGKADFYQMSYGPYLIVMNTTTGRTFELKAPSGTKSARELVSGKIVNLNRALKVGPRSTVVLYSGK
ncbi:hypothetical protein IAD21_05625 [Abditibacteriota bacterium]|nr:hypothetical protein IAD21_05625 [Abditibacteriota bacterium]